MVEKKTDRRILFQPHEPLLCYVASGDLIPCKGAGIWTVCVQYPEGSEDGGAVSQDDA